MELEHSFTVPVPKSRAWDVLLDVERVAPCMPGATLDSVDGDEIRGRIKVKVGPINMTYAGTARFVERDEEAGIVTLEASGKETRGAGTASASVKSVLEDHGNETFVKVLTTLNVTGKPAQFGRGVMNEVGGKLLGIFAANLAATLAEDGGESGGGSAGGGSAAVGSAAVGSAAVGSAGGGSADGASAAPAGPATAPNGSAPIATTQAAGTSAADAAGAAPGSGASAPTGSTPAADTSIDDLKLPARATSSLRRDGITTIGQLASKSEDELLALDGIGPASVDDIKAKLTDLGLKLGQPKAAAPASGAPASAAPAAPASGPGSAPVPHASAGRHAAQQLEDEAINLLKVAGLPVLKRVIPVLAGVVAALLIGLRAKARRRRK
jgi:carbon monoxide dehydrogenase subunit G